MLRTKPNNINILFFQLLNKEKFNESLNKTCKTTRFAGPRIAEIFVKLKKFSVWKFITNRVKSTWLYHIGTIVCITQMCESYKLDLIFNDYFLYKSCSLHCKGYRRYLALGRPKNEDDLKNEVKRDKIVDDYSPWQAQQNWLVIRLKNSFLKFFFLLLFRFLV